MVRPEEASELAVENVLGLSSVRDREVGTASTRVSTQELYEAFIPTTARADMSLTSSLPFR